jgi:hypothetical protein
MKTKKNGNAKKTTKPAKATTPAKTAKGHQKAQPDRGGGRGAGKGGRTHEL